jgi:hypothetical protein
LHGYPAGAVERAGLRAHQFSNSCSGAVVITTRKLGLHASGASGAVEAFATCERRAKRNSPWARGNPDTRKQIGGFQPERLFLAGQCDR